MAGKALGVLLGLAVVAGIAGLAYAKPKQKEEEPETGPEVPSQSVAEQQYALAMAPSMTDPEYVQRIAVWLSSSGQRPDLAAKCQEKQYALTSEIALRRALEPGVMSDSYLEQAAKDLESMTPTYAALVRKRLAVQQGRMKSGGKVTITLLSGVGTMTIDFDSYVPSPAAPANPPTVVLHEPEPVTPTPTVYVPPTPVDTVPGPTVPAPAVQVPSTPAAATPTVVVPPIVAAEAAPEADPNGTIALAQSMLADEGSSGWKYVSDAVKDWQRKVNLKPDGKFGTGGALQMAKEVGHLPKVRYWSLGGKTLAQQLSSYRESLRVLANKLKSKYPEHAAALLLSAAAENGEGWPSSTKAVSPAIEFDEDSINAAEDWLNGGGTSSVISDADWRSFAGKVAS
jgi:hypothetical protein